MMKRPVIILMLLVGATAFASSQQLRAFVVTQFRSITEPLFAQGEATQPQFDKFYAAMVEQLPPQQRAERALELTINRFTGAAEYVIQNASVWRGHMTTNPKLETLTTTALNAPLIEIRMAGFELYLAQYNLEKNAAQIDELLHRYEHDPDKNAAGAFWAIAAIAARGIDRERVFDVLIAATEHENDTIRRGAVEALARFGGEEIIEPLLDIGRSDPSSIIQERAYCGLAQTGTLHVVERYSALPGLLETLRDPNTSQQQQGWVIQALKEISTFYDVSNDPDDWEERLMDVGMLQR